MKKIDFNSRTYIMGILNLTPDSFSGDGIYKDTFRAVEEAERLVAEGADIIDIGGESTRPGSESVSLEEEIKRVIPVIKELANKIDTPISIDTKKPEVAELSLDNGASIINDITGLSSDSMIEAAIKYNAKVILMHMKGTPLTMQHNPFYEDVVSEIKNSLSCMIKNAEEKGVDSRDIIIDPGIGFGKTLENNLEILNKLCSFKELGYPILIGPSRKSFIGGILGVDPKERIFGTAASIAIAIKNGADIIRVHDVSQMSQVAKIVNAIIHSREKVNV